MMISEGKLRKAIFFDRDGTLNVDSGYVHDWDSFAWLPGAVKAIKLANESGFLVFVVTNQSGVGRGYYDDEAVRTLHSQMNDDLAKQGAHIDGFEYCPHHPEEIHLNYKSTCECRKPAPGLILRIIKKWQINPKCSLLIGDSDTDIAAANAANVPGHLFTGENLHDFLAPLLKTPI